MRSRIAVALLMLITAAALTDAARSSSRSSSRYSRSSYYSSYRSYSYRSPVYSRRMTPSLMGALYFSYVTRYPSHFSYRRSALGSTGGTCTNNLALDNGSFIGAFNCPFLEDEPVGWTKCCGYETEEFCCDQSYDDSWKIRRLSTLAVLLIVGGCLICIVVLAWVTFSCVRKRMLGNRSNRTAVVAIGPHLRQPYTAPVVNVIAKPMEIYPASQHQQQVDGSYPPQPPPYPTMYQHGPASMPTAIDTVNQGFEPQSYPLYPPPYVGRHGDPGAPH